MYHVNGLVVVTGGGDGGDRDDVREGAKTVTADARGGKVEGDSDDSLRGDADAGTKGRESKSKRMKKYQKKSKKIINALAWTMLIAHRGMGVRCLKNHHVRSLMKVTPLTVYLA
jgi:hypothetical protein